MKRLILSILFLVTAGVLSFLAEHYQRGDELCAVDAGIIRPITRVVISQGTNDLQLCSVCCARTWLNRHPHVLDSKSTRITVVDEVSGESLDTTLAYWVTSSRFSHRENKCKVHVFKDPDEAARHILRNNGKELPGFLAGQGKKLPWAALFSTDDLSGKKVNLHDWRGKVIFLRFWSSKNPFTVKDLSKLAEAHRRWQGHGFTVLALNVEQSREEVETFVRKQNLPFPVLLDPQGKIADLYKVRGFPTGFLIDRSGIIRNQSIGEIMADLMTPLIEPLL